MFVSRENQFHNNAVSVGYEWQDEIYKVYS